MVLDNLLDWGSKLKETDYLTKKIKENLFKLLENGDLDTVYSSIATIKDNSKSHEFKQAVKIIIDKN